MIGCEAATTIPHTCLDPLINHPAVAWSIFGVVYLGMALGRLPGLMIDRAGIALLGAAAMLALGLIDLQLAWRSIDADTICLLFGLMLFSSQLQRAGFYTWAAGSVARLAERPRSLLASLIIVSGGLSAVLVNDIVCLAFTPLLCSALLSMRRNPVPYLIALACASNIGSATTLIGNPQNMYIGAVARLPFGHFLLVMLPVTILGLGICWLIVHFMLGRHLAAPSAMPPPQHEPAAQPDWPMIHKTLIILLGVVVCLFLFKGEGRAVAALLGGLLLLCSRKTMAQGLMLTVDWNLILLFVGLFIVNGAMRERGLTQHLFDAIRTSGVDLHNVWPLSVATVGLSNIVSNVPAVLLLSPTLQEAQSDKLWYLLALASTWAGNLTLVGSIANLIVAEQARKLGVVMSFRDHIKVGLPVTILTVAVGTAYLAVVM